MTKHDLKEMMNLGAELGAAKAEVERMRGLLREVRVLLTNSSYKISGTAAFLSSIDAALSQQAEPVCDTCHGQGEVWTGENQSFGYMSMQPPEPIMEVCPECGGEEEPAPAQDERYQFDGAVLRSETGEYLAEFLGYRQDFIDSLLARPAQTEPQPIGVTAVAITRENEDGELYLDWLLEGGIAELEFAGQVLVVAEKPITDDEGSGEVYAAPIAQTAPQGKFSMGDRVRKTSGSEWQGRICGTYSTALTPEGYAVESEAHAGSVQIYPAKALEAVDD